MKNWFRDKDGRSIWMSVSEMTRRRSLSATDCCCFDAVYCRLY